MLVLAMVLQNFDVQLDDPNYTMKIKQNLTIKPDDLYIRVSPRKNMEAADIDKMIHSKVAGVGLGSLPNRTKASEHASTSSAPSTAKPMTILYGSNTGTCQAFAQRLASNAASHGFQAKVADMDSATDCLPKGSPVIIITSSYEGQPPDNAARFTEWLQGRESGSLTGVEYTVFGCGHSKFSFVSHNCPPLPYLTRIRGLVPDFPPHPQTHRRTAQQSRRQQFRTSRIRRCSQRQPPRRLRGLARHVALAEPLVRPAEQQRQQHP